MHKELQKEDVTEVIGHFIEKYWNDSSRVGMPEWKWSITGISDVIVSPDELTNVTTGDETSFWTFRAKAKVRYTDGVTNIPVTGEHVLIGNVNISQYSNLESKEYLPQIEPKLVVTKVE